MKQENSKWKQLERGLLKLVALEWQSTEKRSILLNQLNNTFSLYHTNTKKPQFYR